MFVIISKVSSNHQIHSFISELYTLLNRRRTTTSGLRSINSGWDNMDNNNSLPYGAISSRNSQNNVPNHRFYTPSRSTLGSNNLQDPIAIARNVHPRTTVSMNPLRVTYIRQENGRNSLPENERHHVPFPNQGIDGVAEITELSTSSTGSHNSLINNQDIDNPLLNSNEAIVGTRTGNLFGVDRYFHAPWSINGITYAERPSTNSYRPLDPVTGRPITQLPTLAEQIPIQTGSCPSHTAISKGFGHQSFKKHSGIKRRVSREDSEDGIPRPASKLLLTEEKMAAKMHNLSISNDHCYHINGLPTQMGKMESSSFCPEMSGSSGNDEEEAKEDDNNNMESSSSSGFMFAPGIKEMLANSNCILPQTIVDQMNKPCLAVIPWKPPDDLVKNITFHFNNKTDDEKMAEKDSKKNNNSKGNQIFTFGNHSVDHTEVIEDCGTFDFDDDMDL